MSCSPAESRSNGYLCTEKTYAVLADDGMVQSFPRAAEIGSTFAVDRAIGSIIGRFVTSEGRVVKVLDQGSDQQSFKVVAIADGPFVHVMNLAIEEFVNGPTKPFLLTDDNLILTGTCE